MSKFSDVIKKIEKSRDPKKGPHEKEAELLDIPEVIEEKPVRWEIGIPRVKNNSPDLRIVTHHFPNSLVSEQYRMLRTSLKTKFAKDGTQVIMVSSSIHSEGKSITAANLAMSLAEEEGVKVALIDADLRRGKIHEYFGLGKDRSGLAELLTQDLHPKSVMVRNSRDNFVMIPRGKTPKNPSSLISSQKFRLLLAELRVHYHYIIVDAPPIMSVADPGIMAKDVDGVLFIIQVGKTPKSLIAHANDLFKQAGARVLGYVLTNVEFHSADYRYYKDYYGHYEEEKKRGIRHHARMQMKRTGYGLENAEKRFNTWWHTKVLREKKKKITSDAE